MFIYYYYLIKVNKCLLFKKEQKKLEIIHIDNDMNDGGDLLMIIRINRGIGVKFNNPGITMQDINDNPDKSWDWSSISLNPFTKDKEEFQFKMYREHLAAFVIQIANLD